MRSSSSRIEAASRAVFLSPMRWAKCSSARYVAISSASVALSSFAFFNSFSSPLAPRRRSNGPLPRARAWPTRL